jgi:hypothetical protein
MARPEKAVKRVACAVKKTPGGNWVYVIDSPYGRSFTYYRAGRIPPAVLRFKSKGIHARRQMFLSMLYSSKTARLTPINRFYLFSFRKLIGPSCHQ